MVSSLVPGTLGSGKLYDLRATAAGGCSGSALYRSWSIKFDRRGINPVVVIMT
jgi:hypothetical protein